MTNDSRCMSQHKKKTCDSTVKNFPGKSDDKSFSESLVLYASLITVLKYVFDIVSRFCIQFRFRSN